MEGQRVNKEMAGRVRLCRELTGLSRVDFCRRYNYSLDSVAAWELGRSRFSKRTILLLVKSFQEEGVFVTPEWIESETGEPPIKGKKDAPIACDAPENVKISREEEIFKSHYKDSITLAVSDDSSSPFICIGDVVGGRLFYEVSEIQGFIGELCVIKLPSGESLVRVLNSISADKKADLSCVNQETVTQKVNIKSVDINSAGPILWVRKKGY